MTAGEEINVWGGWGLGGDNGRDWGRKVTSGLVPPAEAFPRGF